MMRDVPIRRKMMVLLLATSIAVMLMMRGAFFTYELITFRKTMVRQVVTIGNVLAANSTAALAFENSDDAREILAALQTERHVTAAALYDHNDRFFAAYPAALTAADFPPKPGALGQSTVDDGLVSVQPVMQRERRLGTLLLKYETTSMLSEFIWGSVVIALAVMAMVLLITYFLSSILQRQVTRPILALAETAREFAHSGDYSLRAVRYGRDEVGQLTDSFNQMLDRLDTLNQELERRVQERTSQLEAANKELEAFSYSVSHDLRAPLRHIDGFAGLLVKSDTNNLSPRGRSHLNQIMDSAKQMGMLVDDLLVFARMGRAEMRLGPVDLPRLAEETLEGMRPEMQGRNVQWIKGTLPVVHGDRPMLRQVLVNLFSNALKYSRTRDPAVIEYGAREDADGNWDIFVRDNGVGFDMKYASKLFGVFQRLHRAEEFEGTGIGLANVQRIVNRHGGRVWADAKPDAGATFHFTLPKPKPHP